MLGRGGFDLERITTLDPEFLNPPHGEAGHVHDAHCGHDHEEDHQHQGGHSHDDQDIKGIALTAERPLDGRKVTRWLNELLQARGPDILRAKGILDVQGEDRRLVFQAVHMILDGDLQKPWRPEERRYSRMVFIGRDLDRAELERGLRGCEA